MVLSGVNSYKPSWRKVRPDDCISKGIRCRGVARIFQREGGGVTLSNIFVMAFSPRDIVGCSLKKGLKRGGGGSRTSQLYKR